MICIEKQMLNQPTLEFDKIMRISVIVLMFLHSAPAGHLSDLNRKRKNIIRTS